MQNKLRILSVSAAAVMTLSLCGCMSTEDGHYENDGAVGTGAVTNESRPEPTISTTSAVTQFDMPSDTTPITETTDFTEPGITSDITDTKDSSTEESPQSVSDISDVIQPLNHMAERDYSALDAESHGYGQGVHFDDLNRPRGAVEFNNDYSHYNAAAISNTEEKVMTLTFDQGYENGFTPMILDTLKEKGVKAVFFIVGDYAKRQPELVERMRDEGHTVGSHSMKHYSMPELSANEAKEEITSLHDYVSEHFGINMTLFRPPKGEYSERSLAVTNDLGYKTVLWSFAYADWDTKNQPDRQTSLNKLIERAHPGAIYLLHSVSETNANILGDFIDAMLAEGYTFTTELK